MKLINALAILILCLSKVVSQDAYTFSMINSENSGLTTDHVNSVFEDNEGMIWFATANGLNRYDGKNCNYFLSDIHEPNSLASNFVDRIVQDNMGRYWLTGKNGLTIYDPKQPPGYEFRKFSCQQNKPNPFPVCRILDIVKDNEGILWCSPSAAFIIRIDPENETFETIPAPSRLLWLYFDATTSTVVAGTIEQGFYEIDTKTCIVTDHYEEFRNQLSSIAIKEKIYPDADLVPMTNIVKDEKGIWWMAGTGARIYRYSPFTHKLDMFSSNPLVYLDDFVKSMVIDRYGKIWAGTSGHGIFTFDTHTSEFTFLTANASNPNGLINSGIVSIDQDSYGNLWISTLTGVQKHDPLENKIQYIAPTVLHQVTSNRDIGYTSLYEDDDGLIWYGSHSGVYTGYADSKELTPIAAVQGIVVYGIVRISPDQMLFGTLSGVLDYNLSTRKANNISIVNQEQNILDHFFTTDITKLVPDTIEGDACVWIGTNCEGLFLYRISTHQLFRIPGILCAYDIEVDREGKIWIGSANKGVYCIPDKSDVSGNSILHYSVQSHGLSSDYINDIMVDHDNTIWVLTEGGINIIREDTVLEFTDIDDKIDPVLHLEKDDYGNIWLSSKKRLFRYIPETNAISQFNSSRTLSVSYGDYVWMYKMKSGKILMPSENKWTVIEPEVFTDMHIEPKTILTDILINGESRLNLKYQDRARLTYKEHSFEFGFAAHPYTNSKLIQFEWRMESINPVWTSVPLSTNRVSVANLSPGEYVFIVRAHSSQGVWDQKGASFSFQILPPWWQTWWLRSIVLLASLLLINFVLRQRTQRLLAVQRIEIEKKLALEAERNRISRDMHDDLGSGLSAIHLLSNYLKENTVEKYPELSHEIGKISSSSEDLNQRIREIIWTTNTRDDSLQSLVLFISRYSHELQEKTKTKIFVDTKNPIPDFLLSGEKRKQVFMAFKEALNNAVKHSKATEISIHIQVASNNQVSIRVHDNGIGFNSDSGNVGRMGNGLLNIKERMAELGGVAEINSGIDGTEVMLRFSPLQKKGL